MHFQVCSLITTIYFQNIFISPRRNLHLLALTLLSFLSSLALLIFFLILCGFLLLALRIKRIMQCVCVRMRFLSGLFSSVKYFQVSFMLLHVLEFCFIMWLNNISCYGYNTLWRSIFQKDEHWLVSTLQLI